jgi:hypothetical protein
MAITTKYRNDVASQVLCSMVSASTDTNAIPVLVANSFNIADEFVKQMAERSKDENRIDVPAEVEAP